MIVIVDYGVGNLFSLQSSLDYLGIENQVSADQNVIKNAGHLILPGVGAFGDAVKKLRENGLDELVCTHAKRGRPLLGICLGMQLLFEQSVEFGLHDGLGLLSGKVFPLRDDVGNNSLKVPHMGWNALSFEDNHPLLSKVSQGAHVYYVHSLYVPKGVHTLAWSDYGGASISGLVCKDNVYGAQFHPEKSGKVGLSMLQSFQEIG